jgi:hypothetical protein
MVPISARWWWIRRLSRTHAVTTERVSDVNLIHGGPGCRLSRVRVMSPPPEPSIDSPAYRLSIGTWALAQYVVERQQRESRISYRLTIVKINVLAAERCPAASTAVITNV